MAELFSGARTLPSAAFVGLICALLPSLSAVAAQPSLAIGDASMLEGDSGTNLLAFAVTLSAAATNTVTVNYTTVNRTALSSSDFDSQSGRLAFDPGVTNQIIQIGVYGDTLYETNETFGVLLQTAVNASISRSLATGTILNDDPPPLVSITDATIFEGDSGTNNLAFQVSLSARTGVEILVAYSTSNGTALAGSDYLAVSGVLSFAANSLILTQVINVPVTGDVIFEPDESFYVTLTSISNAIGGRVRAIGTILNDDTQTPPPANDAFEARAFLQSTTNPVTVSGISSAGATKQPFEPDHAGNSGGRSVWWSWRAPVTGTAIIDTFGSSFDTLLAIYQGNSLTSLSLIASNDNAAAGNLRSQCPFNVISNNEYVIAVDGVNGAGGSIVLRVDVRPDEFIISSDPREDFATGNGGVFCLLETNNTLYAGGNFGGFDRPKRILSLISPSGVVDPRSPKISGVIYSIIPDAEGGWFIGGVFNSVNGVTRSNLVHILPDQTVDLDWNAAPDGFVGALLLNNGILYVGGAFRNIGGASRNLLAALDATNGAPTSWDPNVSTDTGNLVSCLALGANTIYVGGVFARIAGQPRSNIAELDLATGQATAWYSTADGYVRELAVSETHLYAAGGFNTLGFEARAGLGAIDRKSGIASPWDPAPDDQVYALRLVCNTLYVGGAFGSIGLQTKPRLVAFDISTESLLNWDAQPDGDFVSSIEISANRIYVGGNFTMIGGQNRKGIASLDLATARATDWAPSLNGSAVLYIAVDGETVLASLEPQDVLRQSAIALDSLTGDILPWDPNVLGGDVRCIAKSGNAIYLGGSFNSVGGQPRNGLAAVDATTGSVLSWNPTPAAGSSIYTMAVVDDTLYVGGDFSSIGGQSRNYIAALSLSTGLANSWNPDPDWQVYSLFPVGDNIYVGGGFETIAGETAWGIALLTADTGTVARREPRFFGYVDAIIGSTDAIYLGGLFSTLYETNGSAKTRRNLAALNLSASTDWNPNVDAAIEALALDRNVVLAAGSFQHVGSAPRNYLAAIDATTGLVTDWEPHVDFTAYSLLVRKNMYVVAGGFIQVNGRYARSLAAFQPEGAPRIVAQPEDVIIPLNGPMIMNVRTSGQEPVYFQWRHYGTNITDATNATLSIGNAQLSDSGKYDVRIVNGLGLATSLEVVATVFEVPVIAQQPDSQSALPGDTVTLTASASGSPTPQFQWRLNGANIPGATGPTLTFTNVQITNGGSYSVAVANVGGGVLSSVATLFVLGPALPFEDDFAQSTVLGSPSGVGVGSNITATNEPGEPQHVGKPGGKSVWCSWIAPTNGIATFSTRGSSFDTLLAIYTGTALTNLIEVASDEDRGGFFTSEAAFNAIGGTEYIIAVDGLAGANGNIVLSWNFDATQVEFPRITKQPRSRTVARGGDTTFVVGVNSPTSPTYQWFRGCNAIPDATNASLTIFNVGRADLGGYRVFVMNASTRIAESEEAFLEIGPAAQTFSHDKFEDLLLSLGSPGPVLASASANRRTVGFIPLGAGTVGSQLFNNTGSSSELAEPVPCGVIGGASRWFGLRPVVNGTILVDTIGSKIDTFLALFQGPDFVHLTLLTCDDNGAPDHIRSQLRYPAIAGTPYYVMVDGVNASQGDIALNWRLGLAPALIAPFTQPHVRQGDSVILTALVTNTSPDLIYQWLRNGVSIADGTNSTFALNNVQPGQSGTYSLVLSNFAGIVTNIAAIVSVAAPVQLTYQIDRANGLVQFRLTGPPSSGFTIDLSSNLVNWFPVYTNIAEAPIDYLDTDSTNPPQRFYRLTPWP